MRQTFYDVLIIGASKLFDASLLAVLYIIPYAVWGQNLFSGLLYSCNDASAADRIQCVGEYLASPAQWQFLAPRVWANPYVWSFDSFRSSFLILFEIISLEGWTSVLQSAMAIAGAGQQSRQDASQHYSIFFLIYNLIGAIFILSLFVSVIIDNFTQRSGMALLTHEQRQWIDLKKLIQRQRPSRRPRHRPSDPLRAWCFDRTVQKHGWWSRCLTGLYWLHIGILMTQSYGEGDTVVALRGSLRSILTDLLAYNCLRLCLPDPDIPIHHRHNRPCTWYRLVQLPPELVVFGKLQSLRHSPYLNAWKQYDVLVVFGTFATTIPVLLNTQNEAAIQCVM